MKGTAKMMYVCTRDISIHTIHTILLIQILKYLEIRSNIIIIMQNPMLSRDSVKQYGRYSSMSNKFVYHVSYDV